MEEWLVNSKKEKILGGNFGKYNKKLTSLYAPVEQVTYMQQKSFTTLKQMYYPKDYHKFQSQHV